MAETPKIGTPKPPTWAEGNAANRRDLVARVQIDLGLCGNTNDFKACRQEVETSTNPKANGYKSLFTSEAIIEDQENQERDLCRLLKWATGKTGAPAKQKDIDTCAEVGIDLNI